MKFKVAHYPNLGPTWLRSAVRHYRTPLKPHVDLLTPGLNRCLESRLLRGEVVRQVELRFGHAGRIMVFDPKLRRDSPILLLG